MTNENRAAGQGEEGAGGLVLPKAVHGPNWAVSTEDDSASSSPQRAFGQIREAVERLEAEFSKARDLAGYQAGTDHMNGMQSSETANKSAMLAYAHCLGAVREVLALLGEAPPKAEQDNVTYELPQGATVQPQARPMKLRAEVWAKDIKVIQEYEIGDFLVLRWDIVGSDARKAAEEIAYRINSFEPPHQGEAT